MLFLKVKTFIEMFAQDESLSEGISWRRALLCRKVIFFRLFYVNDASLDNLISKNWMISCNVGEAVLRLNMTAYLERTAATR